MFPFGSQLNICTVQMRESVSYTHLDVYKRQVIDSATLRLAQEHPQDYTDLIVRVAGYCAQFVSLMPEAQEAIIARTENTW